VHHEFRYLDVDVVVVVAAVVTVVGLFVIHRRRTRA
jgi:hypothetical protein